MFLIFFKRITFSLLIFVIQIFIIISERKDKITNNHYTLKNLKAFERENTF